MYIQKPGDKTSKAAKDLISYKKTQELPPGQQEKLSLEFSMDDAASYDEKTDCSVLEKGRYTILVGTSSWDVSVCGIINIAQDYVTQQLHNAGGNPDFEDIHPSYMYENVYENIPVIDYHYEPKSTPKVNAAQDKKGYSDFPLTDEQAVSLCIGKYSKGAQSVVGNASYSVAGAAGETTDILVNMGMRSLVLADGPAGIRIAKTYEENEKGVYSLDNEGIDRLRALLPPSMAAIFGENTNIGGEIKHHYASAIPVAIALAQSFNPDVQFKCGDIVGDEMERFGIDIWLAPAVNIQRDVLCGRNFEYYSEDPLVNGKAAAAVISGVQPHKGKGAALKHFCCNNQETNRFRSNSIVSRRALREIYLRGFEIAVKEAHPMCIMTSYNLLL